MTRRTVPGTLLRRRGRRSSRSIHLAGRTALAIVLGALLILFVRWSLTDGLGPGFCCHLAGAAVGGMGRSICWRAGLPPEHCPVAHSVPPPGQPLAETLQAAWFTLLGPHAPLPTLPTFLLYLAGLLALYLLVERMSGTGGALLALTAALSLTAYRVYALTTGPAETAAIAFTPVPALAIYLVRSRGSLLGFLGAGLGLAAVVLLHWSMIFFVGVLLLIAWPRFQLLWREDQGPQLTLLYGGTLLAPLAACQLLGGKRSAVAFIHTFVTNFAKQPASEGYPDPRFVLDCLMEGVQLRSSTELAAVGHNLWWSVLLAALFLVGGLTAVVISRRRLFALPWAVTTLMTAPLVLFEGGGQHCQMVLVWAAASVATTLGRRVAGRGTEWTVVAATAMLLGISVAKLPNEWTQRGRSSVLHKLAREWHGARVAVVPGGWTAESCRRRVDALGRFQRLLLLDRESLMVHWDRQGACIHGIGDALPDALLFGQQVGRQLTATMWTYSLLRAAAEPQILARLKGRADGLPSAMADTVRASFRPLSRALESRLPLCRWLLSVDRPRATTGRAAAAGSSKRLVPPQLLVPARLDRCPVQDDNPNSGASAAPQARVTNLDTPREPCAGEAQPTVIGLAGSAERWW